MSSYYVLDTVIGARDVVVIKKNSDLVNIVLRGV